MRGICLGAPPGQRGLVKGKMVCVQGPLGTVGTQEPGEAGHIPNSVYRVRGAPERPRAGGAPSGSPAAISAGTDGGRTRVRFWILLECSGRQMSPWTCPGGVDASRRSQKPGSVGRAGHNPSRTAGQDLGGTGQAGCPLGPQETPRSLCLSDLPKAKSDLCGGWGGKTRWARVLSSGI